MKKINWEQSLNYLKQDLGSEVIEAWFNHLTYKDNDALSVVLTAPSLFIKNWILGNYKDNLLSSFRSQLPGILDLKINLASVSQETISLKNTTKERSSFESETSEPEKNYKSINFKLNSKYTFDNFVVGKPNEFAYAAAKRVAQDEKVIFNPLFIYGGVGLGKTHLMHSIAWYIKKNNIERNFLYLSAERFMQLYIKALRDKDIISFKEIFRSTDVLMIDDFQFICGKDQTQEEFFHSFNSLIEDGKQIILSADKPPSNLAQIEDRILSRLNAGLTADIHETSYELRVGILENKAKQSKLRLPHEVIRFLASSITSNVRELEGALKKIQFIHEYMCEKITLEMAMKAVEDIVKQNNKQVTVDQIQKSLCEYFSIKFADVLSSKRTKNISLPRQIGMYLSKKLTVNSFSNIGKAFGGKDHSTVLYAVNKIEAAIKNDVELERDVRLLTQIIKKSS